MSRTPAICPNRPPSLPLRRLLAHPRSLIRRRPLGRKHLPLPRINRPRGRRRLRRSPLLRPRTRLPMLLAQPLPVVPLRHSRALSRRRSASVLHYRERSHLCQIGARRPNATESTINPDHASRLPTSRVREPISTTLWVDLSDGRIVGIPLAWFPRLPHSTAEQREQVRMGSCGLHGDHLDEDISIAQLLAGLGDPTVGKNTFAA